MSALPPSRRGQQNVKPDLMIDLSRRIANNAYDKKTNPDGIIDLGSSKNELMLDDLQKWLKKHETAEDRKNYLQYNDPQHSPALPAAAAAFLNYHFRPHTPLTTHQILATNGATALLDTLFFNLADAPAAVLAPTPTYGLFAHDTTTRNGLHLAAVPCDDLPKARFRQHMRPGRGQPVLLDRLDAAAAAQRALGRPVAAVLLANPDNPLGRCYSAGMLRWVARWCRRERAHLVVDEVYALSGGGDFASALSLDVGAEMQQNVHVLWGMSKDFGLGGCRVGFLVTHNKELYQAMRTCSMFTWVSAFGGTVSAKLLADTNYVTNEFLPKFHKILHGRRSYLAALLSTHDIPYTAPDAAFFVFIDLSYWLTRFKNDDRGEEIALLDYLVDRGVFLEPGMAFSSQVLGHFRLNYGVEEAVFNLGMKRLLVALHDLDGEKISLAGQGFTAERRTWQQRVFSCFKNDE